MELNYNLANLSSEVETYECGCPVHECPTEEETTAELVEVETYAPGGNNLDHMLETLPLMGKGMLGIFLVTVVIVLTVVILNKTTGEKKKKED